MKIVLKTLAIALALGSAAAAQAESTVIYHSDGTRSLVVTGDRGTDVYRDYGSGWQRQGYHGDAHDHADVVNRRTGLDDSVSDYREPRQAREPREPREPSNTEPKQPRERHSRYDAI